MAGPLTPRQQQVAVLLARGYSNKQIAAELCLTAGTVANHVQAIMERLGVNTRTQIGVWVALEGLLGRVDGAAVAGPSDGHVRPDPIATRVTVGPPRFFSLDSAEAAIRSSLQTIEAGEGLLRQIREKRRPRVIGRGNCASPGMAEELLSG